MKKNLLLFAMMLFFGNAFAQPATFSWPPATSHDQLEQGPCQAFAFVATMEAWQQILYSNFTPLSPANLYAPLTGANPNGAGYDIELPFVKKWGVVTSGFMPYANSCNSNANCVSGTPCYFNTRLFAGMPNFIDSGTVWKDCNPTPSNPDPSLPSERFKIGDYVSVPASDFATASQLKLAIMNYGPLMFGTNSTSFYGPTSHGMCIYGWDQNKWLIADSWPIASQKKSSFPIATTNFTSGSYFVAYRLTKSAVGKPAVYRQTRTTGQPTLNTWNDNIGTLTPLTTGSVSTVYAMNGPAVLGAGTGTYTIPGLQYLTSKTVTWSYTPSGAGLVTLTPSVDGTSASMSFSGVSGSFSVVLTATITLPNGIVMKVSTTVQAISYSLTKTNRCLATNKREIKYTVTATPSTVSLLLTGVVFPPAGAVVTTSPVANTFTFTITTTLPNSCGVILTIKDAGGNKLGEQTLGEPLAVCTGGFFKPATSANVAAVVTEANPAVNKISVSPNPVKDILSIRLQEPGKYQIRITDIFGKTVLSSYSSNMASVNVSKLSPGNYFIQMIPADKSKEILVARFIRD